jgi:hypothetical protein
MRSVNSRVPFTLNVALIAHMKICRPFQLLAMTFGVAMVLYFAAFVCRFEICGSPVRDDAYGWLGPVMRGDTHSVDIGKFYHYEGTNFSSYRFFRPLCRAWLRARGISVVEISRENT